MFSRPLGHFSPSLLAQVVRSAEMHQRTEAGESLIEWQGGVTMDKHD